MDELVLAGPKLDRVRDALDRVYAWKEAVLSRMLRHWDPAWGMPVLIDGPSRANTLQEPWTVKVSLLGLGEYIYDKDERPHAVPRILATAHVDAQNRPLASEGPFPLPSDEQWRAWREGVRLTCESAARERSSLFGLPIRARDDTY